MVIGLVVAVAYLALVVGPELRCVVRGTVVDTPQGPRLVEELAIGDPVWTWGPEGREPGRGVAKRGQLVLAHHVLTLADGRRLGATANHPVATGSGWILVGALRPGLSLLTDGGPVTLQSIEQSLSPVTVWDITVDPNHTCFANGILTHNTIVESPETRAIVTLRTFVAAQLAYEGATGSFGTPDCLAHPRVRG